MQYLFEEIPCSKNSRNLMSFYFRFLDDPSMHHLKWTAKPKRILVIKKIHDDCVSADFREIVKWLVQVGMVYVSRCFICRLGRRSSFTDL